MSQGFDKTQPIEDADIESAPIRVNFNALATDHAGPTEPAGAEDGWTWLDTALSNQPVIKVFWDGGWRPAYVYSQSLQRFVPVSAGATWGAITGTLADQTDLKNALVGKMPLTPNAITLVRATTNPGNDNTIWIKEPGGHLHRGSVDLEAGSGGGSVNIEDNGTPIGTADTLNFTGGGVLVGLVGSTVTITIPSGGVLMHQNENAVGTKNGVNTTFSVPGSVSYAPGTLIVYLNGVAYAPSSIIENGPGYTTFTITGDNIPNSDDGLTVSFIE